jgi:hypothetical protein
MNTTRPEPIDFDAWLAASPDVEPMSGDENRHGDWNHLLVTQKESPSFSLLLVT